MSEEIDRWVKYIKDNPDKWKKIHTKFINAQFSKTYKFIERLLKEPKGREKVIDAYGIKNLSGYAELLGKA